MFDPTTATSELEAVNLMLSLKGEQPVPTLALATTNSDVSNALMLLRTTTRAVCMEGWTFNTDLKVVLPPGVGGKIDLPARTVRFSPRRWEPGMSQVDCTQRADSGVMRIYDRTANTFVWTVPLTVDITYLTNFEDMPEAVRVYATIVAGRQFQARFVGSSTAHQLTQADEDRARTLCEDFELDQTNSNFLTDSADVVCGWGVGR